MPAADLPAKTLEFVNGLSLMDVEVNYVALRFDSQTKELGLTYSDALREALGLGNNHYTLFSPTTAPDAPTDPTDPAPDTTGDDSATRYGAAMSFYRDMFTENRQPLALPLPDAYALVSQMIDPDSDTVIVIVSSGDWLDFLRKLRTAAERFAEFSNTATNVEQRFGVVSFPAPDLPEVSVIRAGEGYAALADWVGRYDLVYTAVLVMRFAAGTVPTEFLT